jgi:hypothetical protein
MIDRKWYFVIIPFRDRGTDPLREANLKRVIRHWREEHLSDVTVVGDGRSGKELFNRSAAYNRGVRGLPDADGYIFAESDMLVSAKQVNEAVDLAHESLGMVVPFTTYRYQGPENSKMIRDAGWSPEDLKPKWVMPDCRSIGAVNVVSRATMDAVGQFDEAYEGNWYDDDGMKLAFDTICGATRFVEGPADHLYHLPGHRGKHLTDKEKQATARNQRRLGEYERAARTNNIAYIRRLLRGEV